MRKTLSKLNKILSEKQKKHMALLTVMMIIGALIQTAGVGMLVSVVIGTILIPVFFVFIEMISNKFCKPKNS